MRRWRFPRRQLASRGCCAGHVRRWRFPRRQLASCSACSSSGSGTGLASDAVPAPIEAVIFDYGGVISQSRSPASPRPRSVSASRRARWPSCSATASTCPSPPPVRPTPTSCGHLLEMGAIEVDGVQRLGGRAQRGGVRTTDRRGLAGRQRRRRDRASTGWSCTRFGASAPPATSSPCPPTTSRRSGRLAAAVPDRLVRRDCGLQRGRGAQARPGHLPAHQRAPRRVARGPASSSTTTPATWPTHRPSASPTCSSGTIRGSRSDESRSVAHSACAHRPRSKRTRFVTTRAASHDSIASQNADDAQDRPQQRGHRHRREGGRGRRATPAPGSGSRRRRSARRRGTWPPRPAAARPPG